MKRFTQVITPVVLTATLLQLASCGGGGGSSKSGGQSSSPRQLESEAEGTYVATISTLNNGVGGPISGNVSISKEGGRLIAYARLNGGAPHTVHQQRVHVATSCPTASNDANGDGYVDAVESFNHVGKILFPLDADISSQERGSSIWPAGDMYGYYHWERATSYDRFISDLREPDLNEENEFAKLGPDGDLNLDGRVVIIHGAPETANLPDTVATRGRLRNFQTIPVACGVIRKVTVVPGEVEEDPSLGPVVGESVGGSSGVDDGATVPVDGQYRPGETSGGTTGNTNDAGNDPRNTGSTSGGTTGGNDDDDDDGGFRWPWERPRTTTGGNGGGTTGTTTGGTTSGGTTSGGTTGGETTGGDYGDDDDSE